MRIVLKNRIEMVELNTEEHASINARIKALDYNDSRTYTEEEIDKKWQLEEVEDEQRTERQAA